MNRRLASLLGTDQKVYGWLEAVLLFGQATDGYVTGTLLTQGAEGLSERKAERVLMELQTEKAVSLLKHTADRGYLKDRYSVVNPDRLREVLRSTHAAAGMLKELEEGRGAEDNYKLVATLPDGFAPVGTDHIAPLATSLQRLVVSARESVVVLIPFFDQDGLDPLADALIARAKQGVAITLIVREVGDNRTVNHRVLRRFADRVLSEGVEEWVRFCEFEHREDGRVAVTFHAKVVLVDEARAYLGSANLTVNGMERFLELGALLEGPAVGSLSAVVRGMMTSDWTRVVHVQALAGRLGS